jgi:hypothetical protein
MPLKSGTDSIDRENNWNDIFRDSGFFRDCAAWRLCRAQGFGTIH